MKCVICGCKEEIMVHGHYQCSKCGRMLDGDCCQGEQVDTKHTDDKTKDDPDVD